MNTELSVEELIDPLQTVIGVVEKKQSLPILSHVLIQLKDQILTLTTTDMELEISASSKIKNTEEISFTIYNKSGYTQHYGYSFGDSTDGPNPMFSYEIGEISLAPYESVDLSFSAINTNISSTSIALSIWPTYHDYAMKELSFYVIMNNSSLGDINQDGLVNILDIVSMIGIILGQESDNEFTDLNEDGLVNILDVVILVNLILEP